MLTYFLKNGTIVDGSGDEPVKGNVGILRDRIAYVGEKDMPAVNIIDAEGLVIAPGFIDTHGHSEFTALADGRMEGKVSQGITTEINGNCGMSAAPLYGEALERRESDLNGLGIKERWSTVSEYFHILKNKGISTNFATLCGHGNIRASVDGYKDISPDRTAMLKMKRLLYDAVREGAAGLSTGLIYPPGVYSDTEELIELCKALKRLAPSGGMIYASHMRSEGDNLTEAIEEAVKIGTESDVSVHISHIKTAGRENWHKADMAIQLMDSARNAGVRLTCDRYPYIAGSTDLDSMLPAWAYEGGTEEELKRLQNETEIKRIKKEIGSRDDNSWKEIYISSVKNNESKWMEGENLFDISAKMKREPLDALIEILIKERLMVGAVFFSMSEENLRKFLALPYLMIGSDSSARSSSGITCSGKPHPRGFGAFPRFIGRYARDEGLFTLPEAVRKITSLPAETFGIKERGVLKEGYFADITVFDYKTIADRATFKEPYKKAMGIEHVFINGAIAYSNNELTGNYPGRILK
ncbi:MAG: D-aminoacylase [Nitrospirae bacterium]|nr:D-aminoacylase [Nitrospirota bacterium]